MQREGDEFIAHSYYLHVHPAEQVMQKARELFVNCENALLYRRYSHEAFRPIDQASHLPGDIFADD